MVTTNKSFLHTNTWIDNLDTNIIPNGNIIIQLRMISR